MTAQIQTYQNKQDQLQVEKKHKFNALGCPHCANLLYDDSRINFTNKASQLGISELRSVACINCDYIGIRGGFRLLSLEEVKNITIA